VHCSMGSHRLDQTARNQPLDNNWQHIGSLVIVCIYAYMHERRYLIQDLGPNVLVCLALFPPPYLKPLFATYLRGETHASSNCA